MKTIVITEPFDGYPSGAREGSRRVTYAKGEEREVSDTFADLVVGKGLARAAAPEAEKPAVDPVADPKSGEEGTPHVKITEIALDAGRMEQGDWVGDIPEMAGLELKVRGIGNAQFRRLQGKLLSAVPRGKRQGGRIDPDEQDRITSSCLVSTVLLDWRGLENADGSPLAYSKEQATTFLTKPEFQRFREAVIWAATVVADEKVEQEGEDAGNSPRSSAGA